jgi:hypothetical protein
MNECQAGNCPPDTGGVAAPSRKRCEATAAAQTGCVIRMNGLLSRRENGAAGAGNTGLILPVRVRTCAEDVGRTRDARYGFPGMQPVRSSNGRNEEASPCYFAGRRVGRRWRASFHPVGEAWDRAPARSSEGNDTVTLSGHFGAWRCHVRTMVIPSDRMKSHAVSARTWSRASAIYKATPKGRVMRRIREAVSGSTDSWDGSRAVVADLSF